VRDCGLAAELGATNVFSIRTMTRLKKRTPAVPAGTLAFVVTLAGICCGETPAATRTDHVGPKSDSESAGADWPSHGRNYSEQRFSPLNEIRPQNVQKLGLAWSAEIDTPGEIEATPLVVRGVLYTTGTFGVVYAFDARTGAQLWRYDPGAQYRNADFPTWGRNRGVAFWREKVYVGVADGRLIALDARNGRPLWQVQTFDRSKPYSITGAPRVFEGRVIIGQGGGDKYTRGFASAYDAESGALLWRFWLVPGNPSAGFSSKAEAVAARTWKGEWWRYGGGGNPWDAFAYDPTLRLLYIGSGNGGPWGRNVRSAGAGDNLFLCSIVAVNIDTGAYVWHYQTTPGDEWDYDATQDIILATLHLDGKDRPVLMQASKNGFFYVLDRASGELLSAQAYVPVTWAERIDVKTGRPVERAHARGDHGPFNLAPSWLGGHNWESMSFNGSVGYAYIPFIESSEMHEETPAQQWKFDPSAGIDSSVRFVMDNDIKGGILAWNPVLQREVWRRYTPDGVAGGTMTTAGGLVFQGDGAGYLSAYDARSGQELWRVDVASGVVSAPISYEVDSRQHVAVMSGMAGAVANLAAFRVQRYGWRYGEGRRLLVFALNGTAPLPRRAHTPAAASAPPDLRPTGNTLVDRGSLVYHAHCVECHGLAAIGNGSFPDLRHTQALNALSAILLQGALVAGGMPSFKDDLKASDVDAIAAYLRSRRESQP